MKYMRAYIPVVIILLVGFLVKPEPAQAQQSRNIILAGYKMNPRVATSASGTATVTLTGDTLAVEGDFSDLMGQFSGAYIMVNIRGQGGNQIYDLTVHLNDNKKSGTFKASENKFELSAGQMDLLKKGKLYITVNTFENQRGEIRGDIGPLG